MAGDAQTGVSIIKVTAGLDSGPIALQEPIDIHEREDFGSLSERLAELAGELIVCTLDLREAGTLELREQDDSRATYAQKISPDERRLDPGRPAVELERTVRALNPHIGAYLELDGGERLGVRAAAAEAGGDLEPGRLAVSDGALRLGCAQGSLRLETVQPEGRKPMTADAYLRGHALPSLAK
jgi:methionyl-tRNA formyltransferase